MRRWRCQAGTSPAGTRPSALPSQAAASRGRSAQQAAPAGRPGGSRLLAARFLTFGLFPYQTLILSTKTRSPIGGSSRRVEPIPSWHPAHIRRRSSRVSVPRKSLISRGLAVRARRRYGPVTRKNDHSQPAAEVQRAESTVTTFVPTLCFSQLRAVAHISRGKGRKCLNPWQLCAAGSNRAQSR